MKEHLVPTEQVRQRERDRGDASVATPAISIIIVNWNTGSLLAECLESIRAYGSGMVGATIVVDNASSDDSIPIARRAHPADVQFIQSAANLGFAKACNLGADAASTDYLLFLNPDAKIMSETLPALVEFLSHPEQSDVGIAGVKLVDSDGTVSRCCARFPRPREFVARAFGLDRVFKGSVLFMLDWDHASTRTVDNVIGAFYLVRRRVFEGLAGFDARFFVYFEDLDFSLRASRCGWRTVYFAGARAFHMGGGSSSRVIGKRLFYLLRSRLLYSQKHFGYMDHLLVLAATLLVEPGSRLLWAISKGSFRTASHTIGAYAFLAHWYFSPLRVSRTRIDHD